MVDRAVADEKSSVLHSKKFLFLAGCVIAVVSFVAGMRFHNGIPLLGSSKNQLNVASLEKTYNVLSQKYNGKIDPKILLDGANHGMVEALGDKYTVYLNKKESSELDKDISGDVGGGIGAQIIVRNGQPVIEKLLPNNPASDSGLKPGDVITAINNTSTDGWDAEKTANSVRGKEGTTVKLTVKRDSATYSYTLTRAEVNNPSVTQEIRSGVGIMTITRFDEQTGALARKAATEFKQQNVKGVVLDLRSDGGGYIDAAVDTAGIWLNNKVVVTQKHGSKVIDTKHSGSDTLLEGIPTVVLINDGTASASEIVAGALKDYSVAKLMGETSYGKGSVQEVIDLGDGTALKVTIAKWYTPKGKNVNGTGLRPDVEVKLSKDDINAGRDPQLDEAVNSLK